MNLSNCCRLCLSQLDSVGISLFSKQNFRYLLQVETITNIKLHQGKEYPQNICERCKLDLELAFKFRERCIKTNDYFKESIRSSRNESSKSDKLSSKYIKEDCQSDSNTEKIEKTLKNEIGVDESFLNLDADLTSSDEDNYEPYVSSDEDVSFARSTLSSGRAVTEKKSNSKTKAKQKKLKGSTNNDVTTNKTKKGMKNVNSSLRTFICDQCGNSFQKRHHFICHLRRHSGEKPFSCELCNTQFFTQSELNRHMRRHTGERPFACRHCQRRFTDYSTRIKHERTHTNERPFVCSQCDKAFTTSYILKNHLLTHSGERSFRCEVCNKSFQRRTHLDMHYRSMQHKQNVERHTMNEILGNTEESNHDITIKVEDNQIESKPA